MVWRCRRQRAHRFYLRCYKKDFGEKWSCTRYRFRKLVAKKLCYAEPTRSSWPLKQGRMGDLSQFKEDLEQKITTWQREVDLKLRKSVWGAHVRTPEEDDLSEECVCKPPGAFLCCHRPSEMVEQDLLYAYQGLKDTTKGKESVEDHLRTSITQGASNLHSDEDMEDKIKLLDQRVQKLIRTYLEMFGELHPLASCDKLVQMEVKLKPEFCCRTHICRSLLPR